MKLEWQTKNIGEILQLEYGKPLDDTDRKPNGRYPIYGANGQKGRTDKFYRDSASIIVGRKGSAGEINLTEPKFWPLDVTYFVTFDQQQYDLRFLYYLLKTLDLPSLAKGVKPGINRNEVYSKSTKVPQLPEQRRIVRILDEAFDGIAFAKANAEKNLQNARALSDGYLQSVFARRGRGWKDQAFGELAEFRNGVNFTKSSRGETIPILGVRNFKNNFWAPLDALDSVTVQGEFSEADALKENDLVFVRSNGNVELIGRCVLVGPVKERIAHSGFTIRARLQGQGLFPKYICHFLKSSVARRKMIDSGIGTNIKSLSQGVLADLVIPVPPIDEQRKIVDRLEQFGSEGRHLESIYQRKLAALDELKQSLLHQAFSGAL